MDKLFEPTTEFPNTLSQELFGTLVGLDDIKKHVIKEAKILLNPALLSEWSEKYYKKDIAILNHFRNRSPFFIFSGDVGTGKTSLAETFGDVVAREEKIPVTLYKLSLLSRGSGVVGEMTQLISSAFSSVVENAKKFVKNKKQKPTAAIIFLIDEADALAQSREMGQMHHEDKAGVNVLIRGIDTITTSELPVVVVMCTNRINSIDPAVKRRAASIFDFVRPNEAQRKLVIEKALDGINISEEEISEIVRRTGERGGRSYGFTYSDLRQRLFPTFLLEAFPDDLIRYEEILRIIERIAPTPPFQE